MALAAVVLLQAFAVRLVLNRFEPAAAFGLFALTSGFLFVSPGAVAKISRSLAVLRTRLVWWHGLWLLLFLSDLVFRIRDVEEIRDEPVDFWAAYRILLVASAGFILAARAAAGKDSWVRSLCTGILKALTAYCLISVISTMWSVFPQWTLYKSIEYSVDVAALAAVVAEVRTIERFKSFFDLTWMLFCALLATVWIGAGIAPSLALTHDVGMMGLQIKGVLPAISANGVGEISAVVGVVALTRILVRRGSARNFYYLVFAISMVTLYLAQTRSALLAFVFGVAVVLFFSKRVGVTAFIIVLIAWIVLQTSVMDTAWKYFLRGQDQQRFDTLSGRTTWWATGWQKYTERPLTGYGAYAGGRFATLAEIRQGQTSSMHNTYFEVLLGTGPWGIIPVLAALAGAWWLLLRALRAAAAMTLEHQLILEALAVLGVVTVRSVFTSHLIWHPSVSFLVVLGFAEYLRRKRCSASPRPAIRLATP